MKAILEYIIGEAKNKRLSKSEAVALIRQLQTQNDPAAVAVPAVERSDCNEVRKIEVENSRSGKPSGISLRYCQDGQAPSSQQARGARQSITLASTAVLLPPTENSSGSEQATGRKNLAETLPEELAASVAEILYMKRSDVEADKNFTDMGLDSVIGVEWIKVINERYGTSITAAKLYDYPSLSEFAGFLAGQLPDQGAAPAADGTLAALPSAGKLQKPLPLPLATGQAQRPGEPPPVNAVLHPAQFISGKEAIAIVGMSGRYPGAANLEQYWANLVRAKDSVREIPDDRWAVDQYYDPSPAGTGKMVCKWMGMLEDIECFDPLFFHISPAEAAAIDPQHRIFLQEGYKAFEDAGLTRPVLSNKKCGVYLGIMSNEYGLLLYNHPLARLNTTGNSFAIAAARIPYFLNLKGSAIPIDTACSSSLVATHFACQALLNRELDLALVGGVSLYLLPESYLAMCAAGMLSPDGRCKAFDNSANGFVPGEGVGALVLKRLQDAEADRDVIHGLIIGSGINQNGKTNGITAPSRNSQIELAREIYNKYQIDPAGISYIEMHGTGTKLGDLIELEALSTVFKEKTAQQNFCAIGSVKTNIGHTAAASGIAGIQKILLSMRYKKLAPTLHFTNPNEHFNFADSPFYVNTALLPWDTAPNAPRRAGVSSFGFSGTNAHIVLEEYIPKAAVRAPAAVNAGDPAVFVLSAKSQEQLKVYAQSMKACLEANPDLALADVAYTLQVSREAMDYRLAVLAAGRESLLQAIAGFVAQNSPAEVLTAHGSSREVSAAEEAAVAALLRKKELKKAAELWVKGLNVDWRLLYGDDKPRRCSLPTYPFAKERYWLNGSSSVSSSREGLPPPTLEEQSQIEPERYAYDEPYLKDHTVFGEQVLIGVTHGSLAINAFFKLFPWENSVRLHRLSFVKAIELKPGRQIEVLVEPVQTGSTVDFEVRYRETAATAWELTATGQLQKAACESRSIDIETVKASLEEFQHPEQIYSANPAVALGDSFKTITRLYTGKEQVLARIALQEASLKEIHDYALHPLITNSAFQAVVPLIGAIGGGFLPFGVKDIYFRKSGRLEQCWLLVKLVKNSGEMIVFDADVVNDHSQVVAQFSGCSLKRLRSGDEIPAAAPLSEFAGFHQPAPNTAGLSFKIQKYLTKKLSKVVPDPAKLVNLEVNLMDLGLESYQLVAVAGEIEQDLNIELYPTLFFEYPSLKDLTAFFSREHQHSFAQLSGSEAKQPLVSTPAEIFPTQTAPEPLPPGRVRPPALSAATASAGLIRDDIAVIGMNGLFPGASNLGQFWQNLRDKKDVITEIPPDHWDYHPWYDQSPEAKDKTYCKWGGFINDVAKFDAGFFNISPREAEWMDPQLRLLLQSIYATAEDAGCINQLRGTDTGVFVGVCSHDYADKMAELNLPVDPYMGTGNAQTVIANRISFLFDLTGPSIAVDTACSSSLFALHYACHALRNRECGMAFVAGANLLLSSWHYRYFASLGALSPTGRCHTFDAAADGYVPGECIAGILLKPLRQAQTDGDHIYAVVKGSAALHGGYTPSFTAPSVDGEENVIVKAWQDAGINPETISYIEAHGTGTKLGDPIEINSMKKAFQRFTQRQQFCAIGSVKANIGHTEGAAGIAGILKVILQMKHRQIPTLPRFDTLNSYIQLDQSALYLNRETEEWKKPADGPRRAGISSFGMAGTYAHIVLEEYADPQQPPIAITPQNPAIIVLSARSRDQLKAQARQLLSALQAQQYSDRDLADMAYTLQLGREAMEERLGLLAGSSAELSEKLNRYLEDQEDMEDVYQGQVKNHHETLAVFAADEDMPELIDTWLSKGKYAKLLALWVKGLSFDWSKLYGEPKPRRISLPTYPFGGERYWLDETGDQAAGGPAAAPAAYLHPLLHQNTSDLTAQRFSSTFTGNEFFLTDHVVKGRRVLPGVAYLEMARAAVEQAAGVRAASSAGIRLKNVVWTRPVVVDEQPVPVEIRLYPEDSGEISYEIYSDCAAAGPVVHSQGMAALGASAAAQTLDLPALRAECSLASFSPARCYEAFQAMAIDYGPSHQGLAAVWVGQGQVLAKLSLPSVSFRPQEGFVLHPGMLDSALQAAIGLLLVSGNRPDSPLLPFALEELELSGPCQPVMWALLRSNDGRGEQVRKFDIDLGDEQGRILVRLRGLSSRVLEGDIPAGKAPQAVPFQASPGEITAGTVLLTPVWNPVPLEKGQVLPASADKLVIAGGTKDLNELLRQCYPQAHLLELRPGDSSAEIAPKLAALGFVDHLMWIAPGNSLGSLADDAVIEEQEQGVLRIFRTMKALLSLGYGGRDLAWTLVTIQAQPVYPGEPVNPTHAGLHGLIGSVAKEYSNWKIRLIDLEAGGDWPLEDIFTLPADPQGNAWLYRSREWHRQQLIPLSRPAIDRTLYQTGGVYVVIGGAGGIGEAWSEYMIRAYQAQIIWIGRRGKDQTIQAKLDRLSGLGPAPHYIAADASDRQALEQAVEAIKERYAKINGVVHAAIVLADKSLAKMEEENFRAALAAKVAVSVRIAQAFKAEPLDFVLFFSSIAVFAKSAGQSNYAAGCTFKDAFASQLSREWPCAVKVMNWGYWGSTGIVAAQPYQERMERLGLGSIEPAEAMAALEALLAGPLNQMALLKAIKPVTVLEGINARERIIVYPGTAAPPVSGIKSRIPGTGTEVRRIQSRVESESKEFDRFLCRLLWGQLQSMGLFTEPNTAPDDLKARAGLRSLYHRWLDESLAVLSRNGYLSRDGERCSVVDTAPVDMDAVWQEWELKKNAWLENPGTKARVVLAEAALRALPEILTGRVPATEILFPASSLQLVEGIYKGNLVADYFNEVLADTLTAYLQERLEQDSAAQIKILEIGAGTGGTSAMVFQKLQPYREHIREYCYTDISQAFLLHAQQEYGPENPYLTYRIFNVAAPFNGQNLSPGGYDVVIAANVLHATRNIRQTLRNAKTALKKNGLLLLNEISGKALFAHLTFGLLEGWWLYEDTALRLPGCPGLAAETWRTVLGSEGFGTLLFPASGAHELGQQIIAAVSDGVVRQQRQPADKVPVRPAAKTPAAEQTSKTGLPLAAKGVTQEWLRAESTAYIQKLAAETLKIPVDKIDSAEPLEKYGIDSILVVQLTNQLSKVMADIHSTLFFEYQTIDALVEHFLKTRPDSLLALTGLNELKGQSLAEREFAGGHEAVAQPLPARSRRPPGKPGRFLRPERPESDASALPPDRDQDIAVIGLAGRYPGAGTIPEFWRNLRAGKDCIVEIPRDRWDHRLYFDQDKGKPGKTYCRWGGFIEGVDQFDPLFFNISPREAELMDPMDRLFLETVWQLLENAGYTRETLARQYQSRVGVYAGAMFQQYHAFAADAAHEAAIAVSSYSSIVNRVSHYFNFQGPSVAVDTMCSSSGQAVHMACQSLLRGDCRLAIAGGVNLSIHPRKYLGLSQAQLLGSHEGSRSFGAGDGYLPAESVGAVLLKPLDKAIEDRDSILAVIKSTAANHGGHTSGFAVPSLHGQAQLIAEHFKHAGVHPRSISYVEAAANGSALGDAIEVAGLNKAFRQFTADQQFCAIGSVKSNIGHPEAASGIAQLTKVILQLQHQQLVPSIKTEPQNPDIQFAGTPFYLQRELREWKRPVARIEGRAHEFPRRATVSSYGAGGSNAHLIVEEYIPLQQEPAPAAHSPQIVIFSAKNSGRLQAMIEQMLAFVEQQNAFSLPDLAYTLQIGREEMNARAAMVVKTRAELLQGLRECQTLIKDGSQAATAIPVFTGQAADDADVNKLLSGQAGETVLQTLLAENKLEKIALYWAQGCKIHWESLHAGTAVRRIALPAYPFARNRYWVPAPAHEATAAGVIQPLLHQNTSDLFEQRFSSTFTGREFFLRDHRVQGRLVLPGVACLEMARAAVAQAAGVLQTSPPRLRLKHIVWVHPLVVDQQAAQVHIGLFPEETGEIAFEIYSQTDAGEAGRMVHCQGTAALGGVEEAPAVNLKALQAECSQTGLNSGQCYQAYRAVGLDLGPGFQGVEAIYAGAGQALGKLSLPAAVADTLEQFVLHPSMLDSSLHVSLGLMAGVVQALETGGVALAQLSIPFTLQELEVLGKCTAAMWSLVRYSAGGKAGDNVLKLDVDLCDEQGRVCVRMKGFSPRVLEGSAGSGAALSRNPDAGEARVIVGAGGDSAALPPKEAPVWTSTRTVAGGLADQVEAALVQTVAALLKIRLEDLNTATKLNEYGFNSITFIELAKQLNRQYQLSLMPTIFFEHPTIAGLAKHLAAEHQAALAARFAAPAGAVGQAAAEEAANSPPGTGRRSRFAKAPAGLEPVRPEPVAIVGISGKFPLAGDLDQFWENLVSGKHCISEIPRERWDWREYYGDPATEANKTNSKWGGFIDGIDEFDPLFFGISPREAEFMDPQQRLMMTYIWKAIEDAGYSAQSLSGTKTAIFAGTAASGYGGLLAKANAAIEGYTATGAVPSVGPNRMSYFLNIHGPSEPVETACSSSLVALHRAVSAIAGGSCEMAIAGGVNTIVTPEYYISFSKAGMLSPDGKCRPFSDQANGYVRGEGVGMLFLKKLAAAQRDGDHIYAVIRGSAENHGGRANSLTAPNPKAQAELLCEAYQKAGIDPRSVGYIEAHGTGTELGDPIEVNGLKSAFRELYRAAGGPQVADGQCGLGSVKGNIGHLELAAGVAGVLKVLLQLKHKTLVKSLHADTVNPYIRLQDSPFYIVQETRKWEALQDAQGNELPRRAGVSSFGFGGVNAHVVIEEYIAPQQEPAMMAGAPQQPAMIVLSAKTKERLQEQARQLLTAIQARQYAGFNLADMAYTLQVGREAMEERLGFLVDSVQELAEKLDSFATGPAGGGSRYSGQVKRNQDTLNVLAADEDMAAIIDIWISKGKYAKLLDFWVKGLNFDWNKLYSGNKPRRIGLPTYPFARERYWVPAAGSQSGSSAAADPAGSLQLLPPEQAGEVQAVEWAAQQAAGPVQRAESFLRKHWEICSAAATRQLQRTIAIFTTPETKELADRLAQYLPQSRLCAIDDPAFLFRQSEQEWLSFDGCIDLTGCGQEQHAALDWLAWLQKLIEHGHKDGLVLLGVTKGLETYRNTAVNLSGATRAGLYRMLQSEYRHLRSRHMDVERATDDDTLARQIAAEFHLDSRDAEVCYRDGRRYRAVLAPVQVFDGGREVWDFPEGHVLWITGGTRGLGYLCAEHFVRRHGVKRLVLTGRERMPPREQWASYRESTPLARKIKAVQALEAHGAQVEVLSVPLTDSAAVRRSLQEIKARWGPIGGLLHCAGLSDRENPAFIRKSAAGIEQVLAPKTAGLASLYQTFLEEPLQFFMLFSSVSAIIPALAAGQSDYAMANAYMDYFAEANSHSSPIVSIEWPNWQETGMGEVKSKAYRQTGLLSHTNAEGLQFLDRILSGKAGPVILPAVVDPALWRPAGLMQSTISKDAAAPRPMERPDARPPQNADDLLQAVQAWLVSLFSRELKLDRGKWEADVPFQEYGMDSILLAQVITRMDRELRTISLEPSVLLEYPTLGSLAAYLTQTYPEAMAALFAIEEVKEKSAEPSAGGQPASPANHSSPDGHKDRIAVVGIACHFPDAGNIQEYWDNLRSGKDSMREVPASRWDWEKYYDARPFETGKSISKWGAFIDGIENFDPDYFKIPASLAPQIDPLQRQWLEVSAEALADAGYGKKDLWGKRVGVFAGARSANFIAKLKKKDKGWVTGVGQNFIAVHLAHVYNFTGPNMVVDAACASALTAIHLAVKSLQNGEAEIALAGGVDILLDEQVFVGLSAAGILSPDGRCKTFDAGADGIGLGEGCGVLVLKPLHKAVQDNNKIYGVIDGSALNSDGNTMGVTTPNPEAQQALIKTVVTAAGVSPETISYVETHGTGTLIGDPIELRALTRVFTEHTAKKQFCGVGSVKSNIGHLLSAAGAAGIIKVLLAITRQELPPTLHCATPNPRFNFAESPFYPVQNAKKWTSENGILRAGVSAFGLGGNNAHLIVSNEGIPATHKATLKSRGNKISFQRKRCWPEEAAAFNNDPAQETFILPEQDEVHEFNEFFNIEEV